MGDDTRAHPDRVFREVAQCHPQSGNALDLPKTVLRLTHVEGRCRELI